MALSMSPSSLFVCVKASVIYIRVGAMLNLNIIRQYKQKCPSSGYHPLISEPPWEVTSQVRVDAVSCVLGSNASVVLF